MNCVTFTLGCSSPVYIAFVLLQQIVTKVGMLWTKLAFMFKIVFITFLLVHVIGSMWSLIKPITENPDYLAVTSTLLLYNFFCVYSYISFKSSRSFNAKIFLLWYFDLISIFLHVKGLFKNFLDLHSTCLHPVLFQNQQLIVLNLVSFFSCPFWV